jgi:hypothetical protein
MTSTKPMARPEAEAEDAHPKLVGAIAAALALIVALGIIGGLAMVDRSNIEAEKTQRGSDEYFEHGALATSDVQRSWAEINRSLVPETSGYAWIDRRAGIVRIPVDRAIDLICAEQGKPNGSLSGKQDPR